MILDRGSQETQLVITAFCSEKEQDYTKSSDSLLLTRPSQGTFSRNSTKASNIQSVLLEQKSLGMIGWVFSSTRLKKEGRVTQNCSKHYAVNDLMLQIQLYTWANFTSQFLQKKKMLAL